MFIGLSPKQVKSFFLKGENHTLMSVEQNCIKRFLGNLCRWQN